MQIGTTIGLVVALILAGAAVWQWRMAAAERGVVQAQTKLAEAQKKEAQVQREPAIPSLWRPTPPTA